MPNTGGGGGIRIGGLEASPCFGYNDWQQKIEILKYLTHNSYKHTQ